MTDKSFVLPRVPLVYLGSILVGVMANLLWPVQAVPSRLEWVGWLAIVVGIGLFTASVLEFRHAGTPVPSQRPVRTLVRSGPYRFSRNPIYLAFTLAHLGVALVVNSVWLLATLVATTVAISCAVIAREERRLTAQFGEAYLHYKDQVRRWI